MRFVGGFILCFCASCVFAAPDGAMVRAAKSLISVQNFPKTFNDLSFTSRMAVLAEGYEEVATEYDENGVCVSGCAYHGMRIEDEERMIERATVELEKLIELENVRSGYDTQKNSIIQSQSIQQQGVGNEKPDAQQYVYVQPGAQVAPAVSGAHQPGAQVAPAVSGAHQPGAQVAPAVSGAHQPGAQVAPAVSGAHQPVATTGGGVATVNTVAGKQSFLGPPVRGAIKVGSDFGERRPPSTKGGNKGSRYHRGVDIKATTGTPLYAAADGNVNQAYFSKTGGNTVVITHPFSGTDKVVETVYMHMDRIDVKAGQKVSKGQQIGTAGNTGNSGGAHLHYAIRFDGVNVDPLGSRIKPVIDKGQQVAASTKGTNYLGEAYCIKPGISSTRLRPDQGNDAALRQNFPQCTGWCENYYN
ncbi:MAG: peptidoglycan DD-metalloendopeptidase family protein [Alphaproteobacteria bacterium]|nr:peptidoglycan DD-metalloendopeptidase family protein [Alphaproteobacteria bacterium]